jgi:hypothetical protein
MKTAMEDEMNVRMNRGLFVLFLQSAGILSGLTMMALMARYGSLVDFSSLF